MTDGSDFGRMTIAELRAGWIGPAVALMWLLLAGFGVGAIAGAINHLPSVDVGSEAGGFFVAGVIFAAPGVVAGLWIGLDTAWRSSRTRRGRIEIDGDRLVIHDRWLLRRPLTFHRSEIAGLARSRAAIVGRDQRESAGAVIVDWSTRTNLIVSLRHPTPGFEEAIRTLPSRYGPSPISRHRGADELLFRVVDPGASARAISDWLSVRSTSVALARPHGLGCGASIAVTMFWLASGLGIVMAIVGVEMAR